MTDALIGLRLTSAVVGLAAVLAIAWGSGGDRGRVVAMAGLVLIPSALASDVGLRASGRFGGLALAQAIRAVGLASGVAWLVADPEDACIAAGCVVAAELGSSAVLLLMYRRDHGGIRPSFRRRTWTIIARRGAVAGASRFARVGLYAADLLILGILASTELGPYAAARRVAFALLALGLVMPSAVAPRIARAWASGASETRIVIIQSSRNMLFLALPATVGLLATADRWMPLLFGDGYREGGVWLALIVARLPFVLVSNVQQAALIACRREAMTLRLLVGMVSLGIVGLPPLAIALGAWGVGLGVLAIEAVGAVFGWFALRGLGVAPCWHYASGPSLAGCLGLAMTCWLGREWPLAVVVVAGAGVYAGIAVLLQWPRYRGQAPPSPIPRQSGRDKGDRHLRCAPEPVPVEPTKVRRKQPCWSSDRRREADLMTIDEPGYFERLARVEAGHWWSRAMWRQASDWLSLAIRGRRGLAALDIGCGAGLSLIRLAGHREIARVVGLEPAPGALRLARRHRGFEVVEGSALELPFANQSFDVVTCFDVLQHLPDGGDRVAVSEITRVLKPGGLVVVRANSAGFGPGRRRGGSAYRLGELVEVLVDAGLNIKLSSYVNSLPSLAQEARGRLKILAGPRGRTWRAHPSGGGLRLDVPGPWANRIMGGVSAFERRATRLVGVGLPFGHSTMVLADRSGGK